jgi:hypothetical protein
LLRRILLLVALAVPLTLIAGSAHAVPGQMTWTDSGLRGSSTSTFTAAAPLCSSGTVRDVGGIVGIKMQHTCADGSGTFEFETFGPNQFRFTAAGTGRYASLRGSGSCSVSGNDDGTFTRPCHALADFDDTSPSAAIKSAHVSRAGRAFKLRAVFETSDNVDGNAVSYRLSVAGAGHTLGHIAGSTLGGSVKVSLKVKPPKRARRLTVSLHVVDPLGNARTVSRSAPIPR